MATAQKISIKILKEKKVLCFYLKTKAGEKQKRHSAHKQAGAKQNRIEKLSKPEFTQSVKQGVPHHCSLQIQNSIYKRKRKQRHMSVPANNALGAHEEVKKDLVDILKMYMPANLNQIPAYVHPKRLYTVQSTVVHTKHNKALAAPKAVKVERCQHSRYTKSHKGLAGGATLAQNSALLEASKGAKNKNTALSAPSP